MGQYIGARYVPRFMGTFDPTQAYENLDVVDNGLGTSYISRTMTPPGTSLTDTTYWALYGASNGAIINLQNQIGDLSDLATTDQSNLVNAINELDSENQALANKTIHQYNTIADMIADQNLSADNVAYCKGYYAINDMGGAFYNISANSSGFYQTLSNGLYANLIIESVMTPEQFGAKGDGIADDTVAINNALTYANNVKFENNYKVDTASADAYHVYIDVPSNRTLSGNGTIEVAANSYDQYAIFGMIVESATPKTNITFDGLTIIGDKSTHTGNTGEWGFGIAIYGANNITIRNCKISDCWGDGIYAGRYGTDTNNPHDIKICGNILDGCRRNNISVVSCERVLIDGNSLLNANGTSPQAGIDIEPDQNTIDLIDDVVISNNIVKDNTGYGINVAYTDIHGTTFNTRNVKIIGNDISGAGCIGSFIQNAVSGQGAANTNLVIANNIYHDLMIFIICDGTDCLIDNNIFRNSATSTISNCLRANDGLGGHYVISNNVIENCWGVQQIAKFNNCRLDFINNVLSECDAPVTLQINGKAYVKNNVMKKYETAREVVVIQNLSVSEAVCISDNVVCERNSPNTSLVFVQWAAASPDPTKTAVSNNIVECTTFGTETTYYGGNNFMNGVAV